VKNVLLSVKRIRLLEKTGHISRTDADKQIEAVVTEQTARLIELDRELAIAQVALENRAAIRSAQR